MIAHIRQVKAVAEQENMEGSNCRHFGYTEKNSLLGMDLDGGGEGAA